MLPIAGYSNTRVNSIDTTSEKDEFGQWVHMHNFRSAKSSAHAKSDEKNTKREVPFAVLLKQADQDNNAPQRVELRPRSNFASALDIIV